MFPKRVVRGPLTFHNPQVSVRYRTALFYFRTPATAVKHRCYQALVTGLTLLHPQIRDWQDDYIGELLIIGCESWIVNGELPDWKQPGSRHSLK
jgi:hypothetical protein